jgi:hypothetical protein
MGRSVVDGTQIADYAPPACTDYPYFYVVLYAFPLAIDGRSCKG